MRLKVVFDAEDSPVVLAWNYPVQLQGMIYRAIESCDPQFAQALHNEGYRYFQRRYKLFVYSLLYGQNPQPFRNGVQLDAPLRWWIASPLTHLIEAFANGLLRLEWICIGSSRLRVERVEVEQLPQWGNHQVWFRTLSPVIASTVVDESGQRRKRFLLPEDEDWVRVVEQNLRSKAYILGLDPPAEEHLIVERVQGRSRLFDVHGTHVRGWEGRLSMRGPELLLTIAYEAGLGERNAQGFGLVAVDIRKLQSMS